MAEVAVAKQPKQETTEAERFFGMEAPLFRSSIFNVNPFALMRQFTEDMDRTLGREPGGRELEGAGLWSPAIEVKRKNGDVVVTAELPGLKKEDVQVNITGNLMTLEGERKQEKEEKREGFYHSERSYGKFLRKIELPEGARTEQATAEFKDGVLEVKVPVTAAAKDTAKTVPVK